MYIQKYFRFQLFERVVAIIQIELIAFSGLTSNINKLQHLREYYLCS